MNEYIIECPECKAEVTIGLHSWTETLGSYAGPYAGAKQVFIEVVSFEQSCTCEIDADDREDMEMEAIEEWTPHQD